MLSHFKPLVAVLREVAADVAVVTHCTGRRGEIEALGVRVVEFDFGRWSNNPVREAFAALRLARLLRAEKPDVVHLVAMKPIVLGCFALQFGGPQHAVVHMTGLGQLGFATEGLVRLFRGLSLRPIARVLKKPSTYLLVENPDDLEYLQGAGIEFGRRHAVVPGAGIDPQEFPALDPPRNEVPVAAFVGRMIKPKGIDVLMRAFEQLRRNSVRIELELFGATDPDDPEAITPEALKAWCAQYGARWDGYASDIREAWRRADMFVLPARTREGMPRAMLEAAACARPLIVSDVSGCRHFVSRWRRGFGRGARGCDGPGRGHAPAGSRSGAARADGNGGAPQAAGRLHREPRQGPAEGRLQVFAAGVDVLAIGVAEGQVRIVVTGASGFCGRATCRALEAAGHHVTAVVRTSGCGSRCRGGPGRGAG